MCMMEKKAIMVEHNVGWMIQIPENNGIGFFPPGQRPVQGKEPGKEQKTARGGKGVTRGGKAKGIG